MKRVTLIVFSCFLSFSILKAQSSCADCPIAFGWGAINSALVISHIEVSGSVGNDLSTSPLVEVCVNIEHEWLSDIFIVLESPGGKRYFLMGDEANNSGDCAAPAPQNMNACFVPGSDNPINTGQPYFNNCNGDPFVNCYVDDWSVACSDVLFSNIIPTAMPTPNCDLMDFNEAGDPVNGVWNLYIGCVCANQEWEAVLIDWSLDFATSEPLVSSVPGCIPEAAVMQTNENVICKEANANYFYAQTTNYYDDILLAPYYYQNLNLLLTEDEEILKVTQTAFLIDDYAPGNYLTKQISVHVDDQDIIMNAEGETLETALNIMDLAGACYDLSVEYHPVTITEAPEPVYLEATICPGDCHYIGWQSFCEAGTYEVTIDNATYYECDTAAVLVLEVLEEEAVATMKQAPCLGESLQLEVANAATVSWNGPNGFYSTELNPVIENFSENMIGTYTAWASTSEGCFQIREVEVWSNCQFVETVLEMELGEELCFNDIIEAPDYCYSNGVGDATSFILEDQCLQITAVAEGVDTICVSDLNGEETAHRIIISVPTPTYTWPGDLNADGFCNHIDVLYLGFAYNEEGYPRTEGDSEWTEQYAPSWTPNTPVTNVNAKHQDANGNGAIEETDIDVIANNWGSNHPNALNPGLLYDAGTAPNLTSMSLDLPELIPGNSYEIPLNLGSEDNPAEDIYGFAFTIDMPAELVGSISLEFTNSFLGNETADWLAHSNYNFGKLRAGITRLNNEPVSGYGQIAILHLEVAVDFPNNSSVVFNLAPDLCLNEEEEFCGILRTQQNTLSTNTKPEALPTDWVLAPNPASDYFWLKTGETMASSVQIINTQNRILKDIKPTSNAFNIGTDDLPNAVYIIVIETEEAKYYQKLIIQK